jgi:hypothetical protein
MPHWTQPLAFHQSMFKPTSLLVVANTHPLLSLVCQQLLHPLLALPPFHTPQFRLHYLHRWHQQLQSSSSRTTSLNKFLQVKHSGTTFKFEYLREIDTKFKNNLGYDSGSIWGWFMKKTKGRKSRASGSSRTGSWGCNYCGKRSFTYDFSSKGRI